MFHLCPVRGPRVTISLLAERGGVISVPVPVPTDGLAK